MDENLEDVRRDIESTRLALGEKIGRLEHKIQRTATETLNPAYYVRTRPWPTLGVFALLGWMVGRALKPKREKYTAGGPPSLTGSVIRSLVSGAASALGVAAGDVVRDFVKDRRHRSP